MISGKLSSTEKSKVAFVQQAEEYVGRVHMATFVTYEGQNQSTRHTACRPQ